MEDVTDQQQQREQQLRQWVQQQLRQLRGDASALQMNMVSGDASFRRYFRVHLGDEHFIAVDAPPENEDSETFVRVDQLLADAGMRVPAVHAAEFDPGFMLLEDFGDEVYLQPLLQMQAAGDVSAADSMYRAAIDALIAMQARADKERLDPYDRKALHREMALFEEWFCTGLLQLSLGDGERRLIADTLQFLEDSALAQETVVVHRDYHSRNLMRLHGETDPGVIDFQDAVRGPYSYDLVSLLRDCYIGWPEHQVAAWADYYLGQARQAGIAVSVSPAQFHRDFDLMGLQRHLKVTGIFSRLFIRDNKSRYLADIPQVIHYFTEISSRYSELSAFRDWFQHAVLPLSQKRLPQKRLSQERLPFHRS